MCSLSSRLLKKEAAGFFASGRRLEFEECIANFNVDFVGIQEGRQRSSVTRQVGRYFVVSAAADRGHGGPEAWVHHKHVSNPKHIITLLSDSRRLVVRLSERQCQLDLIVLHASVRSNLRDKASSVTVVGKHASRVDCIAVASLFHLVC